MIKTKEIIKTSISFFILIFSFFLYNQSFASVDYGIIDETYKYAYNENTGWINFKDSNSDIYISDTQLIGYAYSENMGWISLNCSNTNTCDDNNYKVSNTEDGILSGYAYSENTGWINFDGVTINTSGQFIGYAYGENIGYISFNCFNDDKCDENNYKVKTD
ncbi:MAG: hypothetical protein PHZ07_04750 [Patescibacteria group bacterium]|nr:hypothetical protein [Patescibacteria group bacterium]MDD4304647.1 hypothetical protein [Patescibacteria group bacterium]MDD4695712.1 hypothetical protein [Patescibacteria group bacterium]